MLHYLDFFFLSSLGFGKTSRLCVSWGFFFVFVFVFRFEFILLSFYFFCFSFVFLFLIKLFFFFSFRFFCLVDPVDPGRNFEVYTLRNLIFYYYFLETFTNVSVLFF